MLIINFLKIISCYGLEIIISKIKEIISKIKNKND